MSVDPDDVREPHLRRDDFLGAFALIESEAGVLMARNKRRIGGVETSVWDLPGGQVEPGERLHEALVRELREELAIEARGEPTFLFYQEGVREIGDARAYAWRSFFFRVDDYAGEPRATSEIEAIRWLPRAAMAAELHAPYHDSFLAWLESGGAAFRSVWRD